MKNSNRAAVLSPVFLGLGVAALVLHRWLFTLVEDETAWLLPGATLPEILLWVLMAAAAVLAFLFTRKTVVKPMGRVVPAVSSLLLAGGTASLLLEQVAGPAALVLVYRVLSVLAAAALVAAAVLYGTGRKVPFLLELPVCLLFVAQLLICYQLWSEVPQLMNYVLGLGAVLCLALAGFFHLARAAGLPGKPWYNAVGLLGVFFCAAAVAQGTFSWFFTTAAVWLAGIYAGLAPAEG